jgi:hypothetical protein
VRIDVHDVPGTPSARTAASSISCSTVDIAGAAAISSRTGDDVAASDVDDEEHAMHLTTNCTRRAQEER